PASLRSHSRCFASASSTCKNGGRTPPTLPLSGGGTLAAPADSMSAERVLSASFDGSAQLFERALHVALDRSGGEIDHPIVTRFEPYAPLGARRLRRLAFVGGNKLDRKPQRERHDVGNVPADRHLPLESPSGEAPVLHQRVPERALG